MQQDLKGDFVKVKREGGTLENWQVVKYSHGVNVVVGKIYGDDCWREGMTLRTSFIVSLNDDTVETNNTIYKLGKPYVKPSIAATEGVNND